MKMTVTSLTIFSRSTMLRNQISILLLMTIIFSRSCRANHRIDFSVVEESKNGTIIGNLRTSLRQVSSHYSASLLKDTTFHLSSAPPFLDLNPQSADLCIAGRLDRERLCPEYDFCCDQLNCVISAEVALVVDQSRRTDFVGGSSALSVSGGGVFQSMVFLKIVVVDINDHTPSWPQPTLAVDVPEHTAPGYRVKLPLPSDPDRSPDNTTANFALLVPMRDSSDFLPPKGFSLSTEVDGQGSFTALWLQVDTELDREMQSVYRLIVTAADGGTPALTGTVSVSIVVSDINDQTPYFIDFNPSVNISEAMERDHIVLQMRAVDKDPIDRDRLVFKFGSAAGPDIRRLFKVDGKTGQIRLIGKLDAEKRQHYSYPVAVSDGLHSSEVTVNVFVINVNDNAPEIAVQSLSERNGSIWVEENKGVQMLASIIASDRDDPKRLHPIVCSIDDPSFSLKELNRGMRNQFTLWSEQAFDRELLRSVNPVITCVDNGEPRLTSIAQLKILVGDVNDNAPKFETRGSRKILFPENRPSASLVYTARAYDIDSGINAEIVYGLDTSSQRWFKMDPTTGQLRTRAVFDRETTSSFNLTLTVHDRAGAQYGLSSQMELTVQIVDVNDCHPVFAKEIYEFAVTEGQRLNNVVGQVHATDGDVDFHNRLLSYKISPFVASDNESILAFRIGPDGSILVDRESIDRETHPVYRLLVMALDHGEPRLTGSTTVSITVRDLNDNSPTWRFPVPTNNTLNVSVNTVVGSELGVLLAKDPDVGPHGEVEYQIVNGDDSNLFDVDRKTGVIFLSRSLSKETIRLHKLVLLAKDRGRPERSELAVLNIIVLRDRQAVLGVTEVILGHEVTILTVMVTGTLLVALMLLLTIFLIRFRRLGRARNRRHTSGTRVRRHIKVSGPVHGRHLYSRYHLDAFSVPSSSELSNGSGNNNIITNMRKIEDKKVKDNESVDSGQGRSSDARSNQQNASSTPSDISATCIRCPVTAPSCTNSATDPGGLMRARRRLASYNAYETCMQFPNQSRTLELHSTCTNSTTLV